MKIILIVGLLVLVVVSVVGFKFSRFGVESPQYRVVEKDGAFEIRDYPDMVIVSTQMDNPDPQESTSFMRLFRYISGENESEQKIAMTTPVFTSQENGDRQMSFIVPKEIADKGAPYARNDMIAIDSVAAGIFAAYRFSGAWEVKKFEDAKAKLANWIEQRNLIPAEEPLIANYDPPYTPSFLKRNEILVRLQ